MIQADVINYYHNYNLYLFFFLDHHCTPAERPSNTLTYHEVPEEQISMSVPNSGYVKKVEPLLVIFVVYTNREKIKDILE